MIPYKKYRLTVEETAEVLKYLSKCYSEKTPKEALEEFEGTENQKKFLYFSIGYLLGLHTQFICPVTVSVLKSAIVTKYDKLIQKIAEDICDDLEIQNLKDDVCNAIRKLIDNEGKFILGEDEIYHFVYGIFQGVDHQASGACSIVVFLEMLADINQKSVKDIVNSLKSVESRTFENKIRDVV